MLIDLKQCSVQYLTQIFKSLDDYKEYVFWIRNHDMSKQYFTTPNFNAVWLQKLDIVYDLPLLWIDYLAKDNEYTYLREFQARHEQNYLDKDLNLILYQVMTPTNELRYLIDRSYRCYSTNGTHYILGISKNISPEIWHIQHKVRSSVLDEEDKLAYSHFFQILKNEFGILPVDQNQAIVSSLHAPIYQASNIQHFNLSKRELECLYHICQGKTYKQTGRDMSISPRTVETHLENIQNKTSCNNKSELIGQFSRYFIGQKQKINNPKNMVV